MPGPASGIGGGTGPRAPLGRHRQGDSGGAPKTGERPPRGSVARPPGRGAAQRERPGGAARPPRARGRPGGPPPPRGGAARGGAAPRALAGSLTTQLLGNLWGFAIIFCGHFPDGTVVFRPEDLEGETRGRWYVRQLRGAADIRGSLPFHVLTGNLSHQIEHPLFPDLPARRYRHIAPEVQAVCRRYGLPYNSRRFGRQFGAVALRIVRMSLPDGLRPSRRRSLTPGR